MGWGCDEKILVAQDTDPPNITLESPVDGGEVSGVSFVIAVDVTDDQGVDRVEFSVNDGPVLADDEAPFQVRVITLAEAEATALSIRIDAFDTAGNSGAAEATVRVATRAVTQLTVDSGDDMHPAWSPDGTQIAFQSDRNGAQFDLWAMSANGTGETQLTADVTDDRNPAWSPDGTQIAFDSRRAGNFDIWRLPATGGDAGAVAVTTGGNDDVEPAWSTSGADLLYASKRGTGVFFNLWRQPFAGAEDAALSITSFEADERAPQVAADGSMVVFASDLNFTEPHIYTTTLGTVGVDPLTGDIGFEETDPAWAPDGTLVVFSRSVGAGSTLWVQAVGGTSPLQVTFGAGVVGDGGAAWSPDGARIAFHSDRGGNLDIWVLE